MGASVRARRVRGGATHTHRVCLCACVCPSRVAIDQHVHMDDPARPRGGNAPRPEDTPKDNKEKEKPKRPDEEDLSVLPIIDRTVRRRPHLSLALTSPYSY